MSNGLNFRPAIPERAPPRPAGTLAQALYPFQGQDESELTFQVESPLLQGCDLLSYIICCSTMTPSMSLDKEASGGRER